jgi:hypothetical protein
MTVERGLRWLLAVAILYAGEWPPELIFCGKLENYKDELLTDY